MSSKDVIILELKFKAQNIDDVDSVGKSDPYLELVHKDNKNAVLYKSEVIDGNLNPDWKSFIVDFTGVREKHIIRLVVKDKETFGSDDLIGESSIAFSKILNAAKSSGTLSFDLIHEKKKKKQKKYSNSGILTLEKVNYKTTKEEKEQLEQVKIIERSPTPKQEVVREDLEDKQDPKNEHPSKPNDQIKSNEDLDSNQLPYPHSIGFIPPQQSDENYNIGFKPLPHDPTMEKNQYSFSSLQSHNSNELYQPQTNFERNPSPYSNSALPRRDHYSYLKTPPNTPDSWDERKRTTANKYSSNALISHAFGKISDPGDYNNSFKMNLEAKRTANQIEANQSSVPFILAATNTKSSYPFQKETCNETMEQEPHPIKLRTVEDMTRFTEQIFLDIADKCKSTQQHLNDYMSKADGQLDELQKQVEGLASETGFELISYLGNDITA